MTAKQIEKLRKLVILRNKIQDKINQQLNQEVMSKMWSR